MALIGVSLFAAATQLVPAPPPADSRVSPPMTPVGGRPSGALSADQVATVLFVDATTGAGTAARPGDRVDVLGYFSRQVVASEGVTRMLLHDVLVLAADHTGPTAALTLAVPHAGALLLQEARAIGARPFVVLRSAKVSSDAEDAAPRFSDTDLAARLAGMR